MLSRRMLPIILDTQNARFRRISFCFVFHLYPCQKWLSQKIAIFIRGKMKSGLPNIFGCFFTRKLAWDRTISILFSISEPVLLTRDMLKLICAFVLFPLGLAFNTVWIKTEILLPFCRRLGKCVNYLVGP
jgi:hypothetical protein